MILSSLSFYDVTINSENSPLIIISFCEEAAIRTYIVSIVLKIILNEINKILSPEKYSYIYTFESHQTQQVFYFKIICEVRIFPIADRAASFTFFLYTTILRIIAGSGRY